MDCFESSNYKKIHPFYQIRKRKINFQFCLFSVEGFFSYFNLLSNLHVEFFSLNKGFHVNDNLKGIWEFQDTVLKLWEAIKGAKMISEL